MKAILGVAAAAALVVFGGDALACQPIYPMIDRDGRIILAPEPDPAEVRARRDDLVAGSPLTFVGTVTGFRLVSGEVVDDDPDWDDPEVAVSTLFLVEHVIGGLPAETAVYEVSYVSGGSGSCWSGFRPGERVLYVGAYDSPVLDEPPTAEDIARWRSLAPPLTPPEPAADLLVAEPGCFTPADGILAALAPERFDRLPNRTYIARILGFRLDDATTTADLALCADPLSAACAAFVHRIVTVMMDIETVITGEPAAIGYREVDLGGWRGQDAVCPVPYPGERFLIGVGPTEGVRIVPPRVLLATPPTAAEIEAWRTAGRTLGDFSAAAGGVATRLRFELNPADVPAAQMGSVLRIANDGDAMTIAGIAINLNAGCQMNLHPALADSPAGRRTYIAFSPGNAESYRRRNTEPTDQRSPPIGDREAVLVPTGGVIDIIVPRYYGPDDGCRPITELLLRTSVGDLRVTGSR